MHLLHWGSWVIFLLIGSVVVRLLLFFTRGEKGPPGANAEVGAGMMLLLGLIINFGMAGLITAIASASALPKRWRQFEIATVWFIQCAPTVWCVGLGIFD